MNADKVKIYFDPVNQLEANAGFMAALAYPTNEDKARKFFVALISVFYREKGKKNKNWAWQIQKITPGYLLNDGKIVYRTFEWGAKELQKRLQAAEMASPILINEIGGNFINLRIFGDPPNVTNTAPYVAGLVQEKDEVSDGAEANIKSRAWSPTKSVLHLALSYRSMLLESDSLAAGNGPPDEIDLLTTEWIERAVTGSYMYREFIHASKSKSFEKKGFASIDFVLCPDKDMGVSFSNPN